MIAQESWEKSSVELIRPLTSADALAADSRMTRSSAQISNAVTSSTFQQRHLSFDVTPLDVMQRPMRYSSAEMIHNTRPRMPCDDRH